MLSKENTYPFSTQDLPETGNWHPSVKYSQEGFLLLLGLSERKCLSILKTFWYLIQCCDSKRLLFVLCFLRQGLSTQPWLSWNSAKQTRLALNSQISSYLCSQGLELYYYTWPLKDFQIVEVSTAFCRKFLLRLWDYPGYMSITRVILL